jgi:ATP-dependent RNA helicase RhlE
MPPDEMNPSTHDLHPIIVRNLKLMGYEQPRPIQQRARQPILDRRDVIGLARTGMGKTAAFLAPVAHHLIAEKPLARRGKRIEPMTRLRAIVLCPTRELAQQVAEESRQIVQGSVLRVACAYGKVAITPQAQAIARGVDLLVATPGRVRELLDSAALSLSNIRHVVIDEADRMLDMGFLPQVKQILQMISDQRQMLLFTSTMPREIEDLAREFLRDPARIEVDPHTTPVAHVGQHLVPVDDDDKVALLLHLLQSRNLRGVLVFCRTKRRVGWVGNALRNNDIRAGMLHGDMSQAQRKKSFDRFGNRELRVLVATDVAARGLHIPSVTCVVNYDLPNTPEEYIHRIGRAAHGAGAGGSATAGDSFTLLSDDRDEKLRWRAILDKLDVEVFAESVKGFEAAAPKRRKQRGKHIGHDGVIQTERGQPISKRSKGERGRNPKRSRKGRPIKKGQRPGRGVIRAH